MKSTWRDSDRQVVVVFPREDVTTDMFKLLVAQFPTDAKVMDMGTGDCGRAFWIRLQCKRFRPVMRWQDAPKIMPRLDMLCWEFDNLLEESEDEDA